MLAPWKKSCDQPRQHIKKQRHYLANKGLSSQGYDIFCSHVWMLELDYKESCVPKNWCFWTVVLEKTLESPLDCKEIKPFRKGPWCWERLKAGGKRDNRAWVGQMASLTRWTWIWASSRSWWWTERPGVLWSVGSQSRTRLSDWTELNW